MITFNILIASIGRPTLLDMLNSLKTQLTENDIITIVFDGIKPSFEINTDNFLCKIQIYYEQTNLGYFGHAIRNKYSSIIEKRDFILHADDDDIYLNDAFILLRQDCMDTNCLYIARMSCKPFENRLVPERDEIVESHIGTPNGIIPYELNKKSTFQLRMGGDFNFYKGLEQNANNIVFLPHIIYQIKPSQISDFLNKQN
jgi:hypothetical protein